VNGYSDRINHALAFAAKHHDQQVRKGARPPYLTRAANVAIILTRYACSETCVVAGILHDAVEDSAQSGWTHAMLSARIGEKFGEDALASALAVSRRRADNDGNELDRAERGADLLARLPAADEAARWVLAANHVHSGNALLADLRRTVDAASVWQRFAGGRPTTLAWHSEVHAALERCHFTAPIMVELRGTVQELETSPESR
jgi:hypothetical protein